MSRADHSGVEDADGVCLVGEVGDVGVGDPAEACYLVVGGEFASGDLAAEYLGDDAAGHVLVEPSEAGGLDAEPGFFAAV